MKLSDISRSLPNGFHDAELLSVTLDFQQGHAQLLLRVWIGDLRSMDEASREHYRVGELILKGLGYWLPEPVQPTVFPLKHGALWIDIGELSALDQPPSMVLPDVGTTHTGHWIYINETNSFIYFSTVEAEIRWLPSVAADDGLRGQSCHENH